jgi:hypothetical protein
MTIAGGGSAEFVEIPEARPPKEVPGSRRMLAMFYLCKAEAAE